MKYTSAMRLAKAGKIVKREIWKDSIVVKFSPVIHAIELSDNLTIAGHNYPLSPFLVTNNSQGLWEPYTSTPNDRLATNWIEVK